MTINLWRTCPIKSAIYLCKSAELIKLPMVVAVPPMLADMHTDMASMALIFLAEIAEFSAPPDFPVSASVGSMRTSLRTASRIGIIIADEAVLEIHIDKKAVGTIKPSSSIRGEVPTIRRAFKATLLCRLHSSIASAIVKPVKL